MAVPTDEELEAALERGRILDLTEPRAQSARYDVGSGRLILTLQNDITATFPANALPGLAAATSEQLADVLIEGDGYGLYWQALDVDLTVPGLEIEINEAAQILGLALSLIQHRIGIGDLPVRLVGEDARIRLREVWALKAKIEAQQEVMKALAEHAKKHGEI